MKPRTLFTWYKDVISDYHKDRQEGNFASHKVVEINNTIGEVVKEKVVHILNPYHIGHSMCIDEKMINGHYCTILSNQETGKIAMLIDSIKPTLVKQAVEQLGLETLKKVDYVNADMSHVMKGICNKTMPQAQIVIDKFHVIKHIYDTLQSIRLDMKKKVKESTEINRNNPNNWTDIE